MTIKIPRIEISATLKKKLAKDFDTTDQAVRNALKYHSDSEKAREIRKAAIELLKEEAANASVDIA